MDSTLTTILILGIAVLVVLLIMVFTLQHKVSEVLSNLYRLDSLESQRESLIKSYIKDLKEKYDNLDNKFKTLIEVIVSSSESNTEVDEPKNETTDLSDDSFVHRVRRRSKNQQ